jgi:5-methyltetrahydropteroyltriglutamate--homocysteine methyltransferase
VGTSPIWRADHVGSLLRPAVVLDAHQRWARGDAADDEVAGIEDAAIVDALALQDACGIDVLTDGEYRRAAWASGFSSAVDGYVPGEPPLPLEWCLGATGTTMPATPSSSAPPLGRVVGERLRALRRIAGNEAAFLNRRVPGRFKITLPAPSYIIARGWKPGITDRAYATRGELAVHVAELIHREVDALATDGVTYIQLDNPHLPDYLGDDKRARWQSIGVDPDVALREDLAADNAAIAGVDRGKVVIACHICRGNARSAWHASGGYDDIAEQVFATLDVDRWLLEYDDERSGSFEPLRFMPRDRVVVLGLITTKVGELESTDALLRRIDAAARYLPLEQLALSPQCGFASVDAGNLLSWDDQRRKLTLVADVARRVWG